MGVCGPSAARCGRHATLAPCSLQRRGVYHTCLRSCVYVCAHAPSPSGHTMVCLCLSCRTHTFWCVVCCGAVVFPMQKGACVGGGPLFFSSPCSLVGPTPLLVSVGGAGRASVVRVILALAPRPGICPHLFLLFFSLVAPLVCAVWHNMVTYLRDSLLSLLIFWCDACPVAVVLLARLPPGKRSRCGFILIVNALSFCSRVPRERQPPTTLVTVGYCSTMSLRLRPLSGAVLLSHSARPL